jgi:PIN domain nuclease of toxin-antitoxin system
MKVVDTSAMLAFLFDEPGADKALEAFDGGAMSVVNVAEALIRLARDGVDPVASLSRVKRCGVTLEAPTLDDAVEAARLAPNNGLSLGDRLCVALALRLNGSVVTSDRIWAQLNLPVEVELIR